MAYRSDLPLRVCVFEQTKFVALEKSSSDSEKGDKKSKSVKQQVMLQLFNEG